MCGQAKLEMTYAMNQPQRCRLAWVEPQILLGLVLLGLWRMEDSCPEVVHCSRVGVDAMVVMRRECVLCTP